MVFAFPWCDDATKPDLLLPPTSPTILQTRLVDLVAPFLSHEKDTVRFVTLVILFNLSRAIVDDGLAAGGAIAKDYEGVATNIVRSLAAVIPKVRPHPGPLFQSPFIHLPAMCAPTPPPRSSFFLL